MAFHSANHQVVWPNLCFEGSQPAPPCPPPWQSSDQLRLHLARLLDDVELLQAVTDELETLIATRSAAASADKETSSPNPSLPVAAALAGKSTDDVEKMEKAALESAISLQTSVQRQVQPLSAVLQGKSTWEVSAAFTRMSNQRSKMLRNRKRRKKRRQLVAEARQKEKDRYKQADIDADEWRAREIAKDIVRRKMEKMKELAKRKAKEERRKLERELELVLIVEKLQELRGIRIQKLKKQGSFFPEEDNKFLERVKAAVEEEEREAAAAADTNSTAVAIANAEEAGKAAHPGNTYTETQNSDSEMEHAGKPKLLPNDDTISISANAQGSHVSHKVHSKTGTTNAFLDDGRLPPEFYHYYYGSSVDMGTLIEVRRSWDSFILPGGSRIPGHWVQPPPPADPIWASCLLTDDEEQNNQSHRT